ncbi:deoxynucleoside kinase [Oceanotoga teriensis]|jgi:deoxyguanosine kinase|uniref:Deoxyguanosine kinase n=1 Tax=Oceanotoga teriensis TaxID=515440 RepID=A0AA45HIY2_9BACT|nr:deoxynucleoside kinase [Oceanotoga teriensis]MDO7976229.1 deoxynucleoside kinase [Oceanotoga teriensis]PWJ95426.1 deoxyguanosine kinase [Oceanotoga teriensis]
MNKIRINIEGNIGSGKTTLANALFKEFKADELILEEFENNPYLPLLYRNEDVGFQTEMFFLVSRYKQYNSMSESSLIISDYDMIKNKIFSNITIKNEIEKLKFYKIYDILTENLEKSDLIIYIDTSVETVVKRIKSRKREFENKIDIEYLKKVDEAYKKTFKKIKNCIILDGDKFDVFNNEDFERLIKIIEVKIDEKK